MDRRTDLERIGECIFQANKLVASACEQSLRAKEGRAAKDDAHQAILRAQCRLRECKTLIQRARRPCPVDYIIDLPIFLW